MNMKAVQFRKNCLQQSKRSLHRKRWKKQYSTDDKQTREENIRVRSQKNWKRHLQRTKSGLQCFDEAVYQYQKKTVRKMILKDHKRPDGRAIDQISPLAAEVDLIPRVHGSAMFTRGQTQICNICTLAPLSEATEN